MASSVSCSKFLLWQFAYTELYFTDCYWPDFDDAQFQLALDDFANRQRRYGSHDEEETRVTKVLKQRVITAVLLLVALIAATTQLSSFYFSLFVAGVILMAAWEWAGLVSPDKKIAKLPYLVSIAAMLVGSFFLLGISGRRTKHRWLSS